jgi:hypothetical protein
MREISDLGTMSEFRNIQGSPPRMGRGRGRGRGRGEQRHLRQSPFAQEDFFVSANRP